jgi:hypothetical protein
MYKKVKIYISFLLSALFSWWFLTQLMPFVSQHKLVGIVSSIVVAISLFFLLKSKFIDFFWKKINEIPLTQRKYVIILSIIVGIMAIVVTPIVPSFPTNQYVQIIATGEKNSEAHSSEVWISKFEVDGKIIPFEKLQKDNGWKSKDGQLVSYLQQPAVVSWRGVAKSKIKIDFGSHPWSGIVTVKWGNKEQKLDLFSETGTNQSVLYKIQTPFSYKNILVYFSSFIFFSAISLLLSSIIMQSNITQSESLSNQINKRKVFFYAFPCMTVWAVYLLAYYPGVMTSDSTDQWNQMQTLQLINAHPVFHTLFNWMITRIWLSPAAIAIVQLVFLAILIGYILTQLEKLKVPKWILVGIVMFFCLMPANGMMVITLWKDVIYNISILWLTSLLINVIATNGSWLDSKRNISFLIVCLLFVWLSRHNGILPVCATIVSVICLYRRYVIQMIKVALIVGGIVFFFQVPIFQWLHVTKSPSWVKLFTPIHQVSAMVHNRVPMNSEQKNVLQHIMPMDSWDENYNKYTINDLIFSKTFSPQGIEKIEDSFIKIWLKLVMEHPGIVLKDWKMITSILWQIQQPEDGYTSTVARDIYKNDLGLKQDSFIPSVKNKINLLLSRTEQENVKWMFWRPALYLYIAIFFGILFAFKNGWKVLLLLVPLISNVLGLFRTIPAQDFRYLYSALLIAPIIFALSFVRLNLLSK